MNTVLWIIIAILVIAILFKNVIKEIWGHIVRNSLFFGKDDYKEGSYEEITSNPKVISVYLKTDDELKPKEATAEEKIIAEMKQKLAASVTSKKEA